MATNYLNEDNLTAIKTTATASYNNNNHNNNCNNANNTGFHSKKFVLFFISF